MQPWLSSEISQLLLLSSSARVTNSLPALTSPGMKLLGSHSRHAGTWGFAALPVQPSISIYPNLSQFIPIYPCTQEATKETREVWSSSSHPSVPRRNLLHIPGTSFRAAMIVFWDKNPWSTWTSTKSDLNSNSGARGGDYFSFRGRHSSACSFPLLWWKMCLRTLLLEKWKHLQEKAKFGCYGEVFTQRHQCWPEVKFSCSHSKCTWGFSQPRKAEAKGEIPLALGWICK